MTVSHYDHPYIFDVPVIEKNLDLSAIFRLTGAPLVELVDTAASEAAA